MDYTSYAKFPFNNVRYRGNYYQRRANDTVPQCAIVFRVRCLRETTNAAYQQIRSLDIPLIIVSSKHCTDVRHLRHLPAIIVIIRSALRQSERKKEMMDET